MKDVRSEELFIDPAVAYPNEAIAEPALGAPDDSQPEVRTRQEAVHDTFGRGLVALDKLPASGWDGFSHYDYGDLRALAVSLAIRGTATQPEHDVPALTIENTLELQQKLRIDTLATTEKMLNGAAATLYDILLDGVAGVTAKDLQDARSVVESIYSGTGPTEQS